MNKDTQVAGVRQEAQGKETAPEQCEFVGRRASPSSTSEPESRKLQASTKKAPIIVMYPSKGRQVIVH